MKYIGVKKVCVTCNEPKHLTEFYAHKRTADKLQSNCKECGKLASKENRGQKRQAKREMAAALELGDLGYNMALKELERKYEEAKLKLAVKYGKEYAYVAFNSETTKVPPKLGVRGTESQSISDNGQNTR